MKDIKGYEELYGITSCGKVWSYRNKKFLTPGADSSGYLCVNLYKDGESKNYRIHRLVAEAYIPNPDNLPQIDHIDNNKNHNYLNNLQWITNKDNCRKSHNKPILQYDLDGNFIREWECAADVGKEVRSNIVTCLKGRLKSAYGYVWKYKNWYKHILANPRHYDYIKSERSGVD